MFRCVGPEVPTAALLKILVSRLGCDTEPVGEEFQCFGGSYCLHLQGQAAQEK